MLTSRARSHTRACARAHVRAGALHVLTPSADRMRTLKAHAGAVSDLSIDRGGEYVGSCSLDGTVAITPLSAAGGGAAAAAPSTHWYHRPVLAIALLDDFSARRAFVTGGLAGQLVLSSRGWSAS